MNETKVEQNKKVEPSETAKTSNRSAEALDRLFTFAAVIILFIIFSIVAPYFFTVRNVLDLALQTCTVTMMGIGVTFVIITGGIDLSIGSVVALSGTVAVMVAIRGVPIWLSMIIGVLTGVVAGSPQWADGHQIEAAAVHRDARHDDGCPRGCPHHHERQRVASAARALAV